MAAQQPRAGLSLYANLLEPEGDSSASISRGPVVSQEALDAVKEQEASKKAIDPALRFQPHPQIRRPQPKIQRPKASFPKAPPLPNASNVAGAGPAPAPAKSRLADWVPTEEDEYMYATIEKRARGGRKKKKKKAEDVPIETDWDEIYDPSRPTNVDEYLRSEERVREVREWKDLLYKHKRRDDDDDDERRGSWDSEEEDLAPMQSELKRLVYLCDRSLLIYNFDRSIRAARFLLFRTTAALTPASFIARRQDRRRCLCAPFGHVSRQHTSTPALANTTAASTISSSRTRDRNDIPRASALHTTGATCAA